MPPAAIVSTSASGAFLPPTNGFASLSIAAPVGAQVNRSKFKNKLSSGLDELGKKLKGKIPDVAVFTATMTGLPLIRDAVNSVQELQDWKSCRNELDGFRQTLERLLAAFELHTQNPVYTSPPMVEFKHKIANLLDKVQKECERQSSLHYDSAMRVLGLADDYRRQALVVIQEILASLIDGVLTQQNVVLPEEYDNIIPTMKSMHRGNGLVRGAILRAGRYDGGPVEHAPVQNLHVITHQGTYKDALVEIKEYFGGPEDELLKEVKELVGHHQTFDNNANLVQLFGGSVDRLPDGKLCAFLVFSPAVGEPWADVAKAKQSVELLCQVAEETMQMFDYLRIKKHMNWDSIKIRPDGTLLIVPTTQGDKFLTEDIWEDPMDLDDDDTCWPVKELFKFFQEADRQGITRDAVAVLRAHTGPWNNIAVWKAAKLIDLRPAERIYSWWRYPPHGWQVHTGMIVASGTYPFDQLDMMPKQGLTEHDRAHLRRFRMVHAEGSTGDNGSVYYTNEETENWFERTPDGKWEYFLFEPWEDLKDIYIHYESPRLDSVPWEQWKIILRSCAKRRNRVPNDLQVITRFEGWMSFEKRNCPELGTRPLYFYRKWDQANATPREFWGFFSFNPDPNGAPGIDIRVSDDVQAHIVSDSVPVGAQDASKIEFHIAKVEMWYDWDNRIKSELEDKRLNPFPMYGEKQIEWPDDEDESEPMDI